MKRTYHLFLSLVSFKSNGLNRLQLQYHNQWVLVVHQLYALHAAITFIQVHLRKLNLLHGGVVYRCAFFVVGVDAVLFLAAWTLAMLSTTSAQNVMHFWDSTDHKLKYNSIV
ncbi:unnamed protein product [Aphis gossypii]|uniref:Uncharacterized protein n=1 Tax=Aphis gossypii TaxID=80765 RepID=A0A9P0IVA8_APHGO|nr:unnamed protein product [Aphis gossypii]